tara:strand:+ start:4437 stop:4595 length:159 start_codon:yes stop_codon:yes gene_type:complete
MVISFVVVIHADNVHLQDLFPSPRGFRNTGTADKRNFARGPGAGDPQVPKRV